ncbi:MAG: Hpt domain-containing protein [Caulobacterales bacterium]|jgi:hypothetical protein
MTQSSSRPISLRNPLKEKLGGAIPAFDETALKRAEAALASLSGEFQSWMEEEITKITQARNAARIAGWSDGALETLHGIVHDAKGLGATYEYPFITRIAGSLCRLIDTPEGKAAARTMPHLVEAHVETMRAIVRDKVKASDHPVGLALVTELEQRVLALGVAPD